MPNASPTIERAESPPSVEQARVRDVLSSPAITCRPDAPMDEVAGLMANNRADAVFVVGLGGPEPWGVVTDRDVLAVAAVAPERSAGSCARGRLLAIGPNEPLGVAIRLMQNHAVSHLMVIDPGQGVPIGVLTTVDVARAVAGSRA